MKLITKHEPNNEYEAYIVEGERDDSHPTELSIISYNKTLLEWKTIWGPMGLAVLFYALSDLEGSICLILFIWHKLRGMAGR